VHLTYDVPKSKVPVYRAQSPSPLRIDPLLNITYLTFNVTKAPFTDPRVRRALALAIDRDAISQRVLNGAFLAAPTMVPPDCGSYRGTTQVALDYGAARQLLAEAGFPGGRGLPPIPLQVLNDENQPRMAEAMQAVWQRELGVRVTIEPYRAKNPVPKRADAEPHGRLPRVDGGLRGRFHVPGNLPHRQRPELDRLEQPGVRRAARSRRGDPDPAPAWRSSRKPKNSCWRRHRSHRWHSARGPI
jgi:ABC-type transport system substrate-binding protein